MDFTDIVSFVLIALLIAVAAMFVDWVEDHAPRKEKGDLDWQLIGARVKDYPGNVYKDRLIGPHETHILARRWLARRALWGANQ